MTLSLYLPQPIIIMMHCRLTFVVTVGPWKKKSKYWYFFLSDKINHIYKQILNKDKDKSEDKGRRWCLGEGGQNHLCLSNSSDDLCLLFCLYPFLCLQCTLYNRVEWFSLGLTEDSTLPKVRHDFRSPNPNFWCTGARLAKFSFSKYSRGPKY